MGTASSARRKTRKYWRACSEKEVGKKQDGVQVDILETEKCCREEGSVVLSAGTWRRSCAFKLEQGRCRAGNV